MKKKIIAMLTVICLLSMLFSISTFASDIDTVQSENHHFTQDEMTKLVEQNIILAFSTEVIAVVGGGTFTKTALVTIP